MVVASTVYSAAMRATALAASAALVVVLAPASAAAQYSIPSQASASGVGGGEAIGSARTKIESDLVRTGGWEVGASLNFLTSRPSLGGESLAFTDLALLRLHGLITLGGSLELFGGTDILPKQPSYTDENVWQGAMLGSRVALGDGFGAWARIQGGPELDRTGAWLGADLAGQYKLQLEDMLFVELGLGVSHTELFPDQATDRRLYLDEAFAQAGIAIRDPKRGQVGLWLMFDYYLPLVSGPDLDRPDPASGLALDPQPRINFHLGALVGLSRKVDLFMEWSILDRGDLDHPATTLPILGGGFDQKQLVFGFARRFGAGSE